MKTALKKMDEKWMNAIKSNDPAFFKPLILSHNEMMDIFHNAVSLGKDKLISHFFKVEEIEEFQKVLDTSLHHLIGKKNKLKALQALGDNGYSFNTYAPLLLCCAALENNSEYTRYLANQINDPKYLRMTLLNLLNPVFLKGKGWTLLDIEKTIIPVLEKCSCDVIDNVCHLLPHGAAFVRSNYLESALTKSSHQKIIKI